MEREGGYKPIATREATPATATVVLCCEIPACSLVKDVCVCVCMLCALGILSKLHVIPHLFTVLILILIAFFGDTGGGGGGGHSR